MKAFLTSASSTGVLALALTPEMTNALAILVAAIFVGAVNLYMAHTARLVAVREITKAITPVSQKIDAMVPVVAKIDGHVNSEKTRTEGEIATQKLQITLQREMIEELKKAAALLAQAKAVTEGALATSGGGSAASPAVHLKEIEVNTAETAVNTKKTDLAVAELQSTNQKE